ncbi:MAG TPA: hypothetical protein VLX68_07910 [Chitinivibrionales bacterium]|nr:hypothetical protein [Chitinivibrionales bacterium]
MKKMTVIFVIAATIFSYYVQVSAQTAGSHYRIANKFHLDGDGGWDIITADSATGRVFVSHATMVQVMDGKTGKLLGVIPDTKGVHAAVIAADAGKGFTSNGKDTSITVFDLSTLKVLRKIAATGAGPDAMIYDAFSHAVFCFNGRSANATVIDAKTCNVAATVALDGKPEFPASDGKGLLYVNLEDKSLVEVIDTKAMKTVRSFSIAPGESPTGIALDNAKSLLFIGCGNKRMVVADVKSGKVIASLPIGDHCDGAAFDPVYKRAYASCGDGTLTVVQEEKDGACTVLETVATQKGARTVTINEKTHHLYLPTADFGLAPAPTPENPKPRPAILPGTFVVLDVETVH